MKSQSIKITRTQKRNILLEPTDNQQKLNRQKFLESIRREEEEQVYTVVLGYITKVMSLSKKELYELAKVMKRTTVFKKAISKLTKSELQDYLLRNE